MLIDTGAWDSLYFPAEIARSFGVELNELPTDHQYSTWLGRSVRGTTVRLRSFRIGDVTFADIPALVDDTPLRDKGLIGMGLIKARLHAQLDTETCVLRW
jgi:clan AA aspartic protease (TIGR02281 family)